MMNKSKKLKLTVIHHHQDNSETYKKQTIAKLWL